MSSANKFHENMKLSQDEKHRRGRLLVALRDSAGMTQGDVAELLRPGNPNFLRTYQNWEAGKSWPILMESRLEQLFQVEAGYFARGRQKLKIEPIHKATESRVEEGGPTWDQRTKERIAQVKQLMSFRDEGVDLHLERQLELLVRLKHVETVSNLRDNPDA
jgi:transcriptional regulator with XRE-family HTH domain